LDDALLMTGDELRRVIGDRPTYELAATLAVQRIALAVVPGRPERLPDNDLIERNLRILRLRLVEKMSHAAIAREVGLSKSRVPQILHKHWGVDWRTR
jgi:hypothetical protein